MKPSFILENAILVDRLFQTYRDRPALITPDDQKCFADVEKKLQNIMANLKDAGIRKGSVVAVHKPNSELHLYLFLASWMMDFLYIPLDFKAPLAGLLPNIPVDFLITDFPKQTDAKYEVVEADQLLAPGSDQNTVNPLPPIPLPQEASAIFTSGSTGKPRGIVHTVGNYIYSALGTNEFIGLDASDRWLLSLPLFHVGGALIWIRTLLAGAACILPASLQNLEGSIRLHRPTVISLVPAQIIRLMESPEMVSLLQRMKTIMLGGAPSPGWLIDRSLDLGLPIMPTYGCTECCAQATGVAPGSKREDYHTSGRVVPYREIRVAADGIIGLGGKTIFKRYLNEPDVNPIDDEGFFKTADSGAIDEQGNLMIHGRTDGVFISGGENISPREVEKVLLHQEGIITAMVVPVAHREYGLTPWAFVETASPVDEKALLDRLRKDLPGYKLPKRIIHLTANDRQGKMKYNRKALTHRACRLARGLAPTQLHYDEAGLADAPVIVFLHGFMGKARSWKTIMELLANYFRCIAFDLPGHGESLFSLNDHLKHLQGMEDTARLILEDLNVIGIQRFTLYGYSMGGRIAQHIALAAPERIDQLILESASFGIADLRERAERLRKDQSLLSGIKTPDDFRIFLNNWYHLPLFRTLPGTEQLRTLIEDKIHHPVIEFQQALNLLSVGAHDFLAEKLAACNIPLHYFCGEQDMAYRQTVDHIKTHLPGMTVKIFQNASHNISIQYPQEIARTIREILI